MRTYVFPFTKQYSSQPRISLPKIIMMTMTGGTLCLERPTAHLAPYTLVLEFACWRVCNVIRDVTNFCSILGRFPPQGHLMQQTLQISLKTRTKDVFDMPKVLHPCRLLYPQTVLMFYYGAEYYICLSLISTDQLFIGSDLVTIQKSSFRPIYVCMCPISMNFYMHIIYIE